jgi:hypothetical protein
MNLGEPKREILVEPLELPEPLRQPSAPHDVPEPAPIHAPEKEPVHHGDE